MTLTRANRRRRYAALPVSILGAALALTGCAGGTTPEDGDAANGSMDSSAESFPVTIDTARGEVTVDEKPERILALHPRQLQVLHYLDIDPLEFTIFQFSDAEIIESYPWMEGMYRGEPDTSLLTADDTPAAEAIAALDPDLILTNIWAVDDQLYTQLSQIAPTYVGIAPDTNTSWQDDLAAVAELTGSDPAIAEEMQTDFDVELSAAADELPGLQGKEFQVAALGGDDVLWLTEYANEPLLGLGLEPGEGQPTTGEEGQNAPTFSQENIDQLTADILFIVTEHRDPSGEFRAELEADPRVADLPAAENGTLFFVSAGEWRALNGGTPTSYTWWLDRILPELEASALNESGQ